MFNVRTLTEDDYPKLCEWWKWFRFPAPPRDCLPNNGLGGIMVSKDGMDVCAGFLYFTNSKMCWIEFIVSNPSYRENDRNEAKQTVIYELGGIAKRKGMKYAYSSVKHELLIKDFEACGFLKGSKTFELVKQL